MSVVKIILLVFGVIIVVVSVGMLFGGGTLLWLERTHTDGEGFIVSDTIHIERDYSYAVVTGPIDIDEVALDVLDWMGLATAFAVEGSNNSEKDIFIGVAEESDVEGYLSDVEYDEMSFGDIHWLSFDAVDYTNHPGSSEPAAPASEEFWKGLVRGGGTQTLEWETEVGSHSIVLMNDDGSAGVDLDAVFKVKVPEELLAISVGLLFGGIAGLLLGAFMIVWAVHRS